VTALVCFGRVCFGFGYVWFGYVWFSLAVFGFWLGFDIHLIYTSHIYISYIHLIYTSHIYISYIHLIYISHIYISYIHLIYTSHIYRISICFSWVMLITGISELILFTCVPRMYVLSTVFFYKNGTRQKWKANPLLVMQHRGISSVVRRPVRTQQNSRATLGTTGEDRTQNTAEHSRSHTSCHEDPRTLRQHNADFLNCFLISWSRSARGPTGRSTD